MSYKEYIWSYEADSTTFTAKYDLNHEMTDGERVGSSTLLKEFRNL